MAKMKLGPDKGTFLLFLVELLKLWCIQSISADPPHCTGSICLFRSVCWLYLCCCCYGYINVHLPESY